MTSDEHSDDYDHKGITAGTPTSKYTKEVATFELILEVRMCTRIKIVNVPLDT